MLLLLYINVYDIFCDFSVWYDWFCVFQSVWDEGQFCYNRYRNCICFDCGCGGFDLFVYFVFNFIFFGFFVEEVNFCGSYIVGFERGGIYLCVEIRGRVFNRFGKLCRWIYQVLDKSCDSN